MVIALLQLLNNHGFSFCSVDNLSWTFICLNISEDEHFLCIYWPFRFLHLWIQIIVIGHLG
jgi:hypothetical protein